ncbi:MAG: hypothetical protein FWD15_00955 [Alphaproteobacteria bacterium]|nr:hypothetical protein [Alphaproteobacteria bacterium]
MKIKKIKLKKTNYMPDNPLGIVEPQTAFKFVPALKETRCVAEGMACPAASFIHGVLGNYESKSNFWLTRVFKYFLLADMLANFPGKEQNLVAKIFRDAANDICRSCQEEGDFNACNSGNCTYKCTVCETKNKFSEKTRAIIKSKRRWFNY